MLKAVRTFLCVGKKVKGVFNHLCTRRYVFIIKKMEVIDVRREKRGRNCGGSKPLFILFI